MATLTEGIKRGEFLVSEANGYQSREKITIVSGQSLGAGAVLGRITVGAATSAALGTNVGNGAMGAVTVSAGAFAGDYVLSIIQAATNAGAFILEDPAGHPIGHGNVAAAFSAGGIAFTLADGATDFAAGDQFKITVAAGSLKYTAVNPAAADGSQIAVAILWNKTDASAGDKTAAGIVRLAEVNHSELDYNTLSAPQIVTARAQLASASILVRDAI